MVQIKNITYERSHDFYFNRTDILDLKVLVRGGQKTQTEPNRTNEREVKPNQSKPCSLCNPIGSCFTQPERFGLVWV